MGILDRKDITIAKLDDGRLIQYDLASKTKKIDSTYSDNFDYAGYGVIHSVNNVEQNDSRKYHFFVMNGKHSGL